MKRILVTAAVEEELMSAKMAYRELFQGYKGLDDSNIEVDFISTGVGITSTSYHLTKSLSIPERDYDLVINVGIAGTFSEKYSLGTVVRVTKEQFGDAGIENRLGFQTLFQFDVLDSNTVPFKDGALFAPYLNFEIENALASLPKVSSITNRILPNESDCDIENMEGAAFFYVALMEKVPFLEIRAVSNMVGERDKTKWETQKALNNLKESCKELFKTI